MGQPTVPDRTARYHRLFSSSRPPAADSDRITRYPKVIQPGLTMLPANVRRPGRADALRFDKLSKVTGQRIWLMSAIIGACPCAAKELGPRVRFPHETAIRAPRPAQVRNGDYMLVWLAF